MYYLVLQKVNITAHIDNKKKKHLPNFGSMLLPIMYFFKKM